MTAATGCRWGGRSLPVHTGRAHAFRALPRRAVQGEHSMEVRIVKKAIWTLMLVLAAGVFAPAYAQGAEASTASVVAQWSIITGGFALAFAAASWLG